MIMVKRIILILLLGIMIVFGIFVFLFETNIGINLVFAKIIKHVPGLAINSISGNWRGINIIHLRYIIPDGVIEIEKLYLSINLKYIFLKQINIKYLFLKNVFIHIKQFNTMHSNKLEDNNEKSKLGKFFSNLCSMTVDRALLCNVHIVSNSTVLRLQRIDTGLIFQDNLLKILPTKITGGFIVNAFLKQDISLKKKYSLTVYKEFWLRNMSYMQYALKKLIKNNLIKISKYNIPVYFELLNIQGKDFCIYDYWDDNGCDIIDSFQLKALWNSEIVNFEFQIDFPYGFFSSIGNIVLTQNYPIHITANYIKYSNLKNNYYSKLHRNSRRIELVIKGELINEVSMSCDITDYTFTIHILLKVKLTNSDIPINLSIIAQEVPILVLGNSSKFLLKNFNLCLTGNICNYSIQIESELINSKIPIMYVSMRAHGNTNSCTISKLKINVLDGYCDIVGMIDWDKTITWKSICVWEKIYLFQEYLKHPISLSGKIAMDGRLDGDKWELAISQINIHGYFKNNNIACSGSIYFKPYGQWNIPVFLVNWNGHNILKIKGELKKGYIFYIDLITQIIDCTIFSTNFNGNLYGRLKLYGSSQFPKLSLKFNAKSLKWINKNINVDDISVHSDIYFQDLIQSNIFLKLRKAQYKDLLLDKFFIKGKGYLKKHSLRFEIISNVLSGILDLNGIFDSNKQTWNTKIAKTNIDTFMGTWKLIQDVVLVYQHESRRFILKSHCWEGSLCQIPVTNIIQKNIFKRITDILKSINFVDVDILLIETVCINNVKVFCTDFYWIINKKVLPHGKVFCSGNKLGIKYVDDKNDILFTIIDNITMKIVMTQVSLLCNWCTNNINENQNSGKFLITDIYNIPKILGNIKIQDVSLKPLLRMLLQSKECMHGMCDININFQGYLSCPKIYGFIQLRSCCIDKSNAFLFIKNSFLKINFYGDYAVFKGLVDTGNTGLLYLNGNITNFNSIKNIQVLLNMYGNQVDVFISPKIYIKTSPDIVCRITSKKIDINGHLDIPKAYIEIQEFSKNTIEVSSEEILLDEQLKPILGNKKGLMVFCSSNLTIHFGDDVNFNGLGFHVKLRGDLEISYNKSDLLLIGCINISSGCFKAYGQNMIVKRGQLLFSGIIGQTYLDIEVVHDPVFISSNIKNLSTSGIRITGVLDQLKLELFSNTPLLSQQKIVPYLLGRNSLIFSDPQNFNNMMTSLLVGASIERYEKFFDKLGKTLGVKELTLNTQNFGGTMSSIMLSGYIAPGLQIRYGIGIFDLLTTITVRYRLHPQLFLEATSIGHNQALDLLYQFDF